jgi:hypothetical protein
MGLKDCTHPSLHTTICSIQHAEEYALS